MKSDVVVISDSSDTESNAFDTVLNGSLSPISNNPADSEIQDFFLGKTDIQNIVENYMNIGMSTEIVDKIFRVTTNKGKRPEPSADTVLKAVEEKKVGADVDMEMEPSTDEDMFISESEFSADEHWYLKNIDRNDIKKKLSQHVEANYNSVETHLSPQNSFAENQEKDAGNRQEVEEELPPPANVVDVPIEQHLNINENVKSNYEANKSQPPKENFERDICDVLIKRLDELKHKENNKPGEIAPSFIGKNGQKSDDLTFRKEVGFENGTLGKNLIEIQNHINKLKMKKDAVVGKRLDILNDFPLLLGINIALDEYLKTNKNSGTRYLEQLLMDEHMIKAKFKNHLKVAEERVRKRRAQRVIEREKNGQKDGVGMQRAAHRAGGLSNKRRYEATIEMDVGPPISVLNTVDDARLPANFTFFSKIIYADDVRRPTNAGVKSCYCSIIDVNKGKGNTQKSFDEIKAELEKVFTIKRYREAFLEGVAPKDIIEKFYKTCDHSLSRDQLFYGGCSHNESHGNPYNKHSQLVLDKGFAIYECNYVCACGPYCHNRVIQRGSNVKFQIFRTKNKGWGVKTLQTLKSGQFVAEYVGEVITNKEATRRGKLNDKLGSTYLFDLDYGTPENKEPEFSIDAENYGNITRFLNHSCSPNLEIRAAYINYWDKGHHHLVFFTNQRIPAGTELCFDYNPSYSADSSDSQEKDPGSKFNHVGYKCYCGAPNCRGYVFS
ncbi:Histone-lysine N-methyltransferase SUV39H1 [Zancudomyces culisetae]|uniref:Histone-lysine N-methyltransferase SUV39H1 n=1 Tax=Zancudomyces culisetae TaxID=1213189 RepID=A0A1R1PMR1_ZANCU|nr:Histone-lysine N-methyltransferase SUV39H1 [Zancudomyces culisetae]|eukprot:OMH82265.1 Histone-lysine N-methyltransferase SUV39H1 [Zancudomyces culisetae]